ITVARQSGERTAVLRWLAKFTGITEWELDWEPRYPVHTPGEETVLRDRAPAEAPQVRQKREQAEVSDADSSDGGVISEGTDNDEESSDAVRNEEWANRQLCKKIARNKGVNLQHVDSLTRNWVKAPMNNIYRSLQTTVQGAVKRLAADLYSGEVHFMLELLQNADDCDFAEGVKPSLTVTFESDVKKFGQYTTFEPTVEPIAFLVIEHNEKGFRDFNIRALCDIAQSTKTGDERKYIGAKGIGFKSVFCATSTPIVHSGPFHFHFDSEALGGLGYLIPFPLGRPGGFHLGTRLVLPLYDQPTTDLCRRIVEDLKPELLLFLRKLEEIRVVDSQSEVERVIRKESASDGANDNVKLCAQTVFNKDSTPKEKTSTSTQEWHVHRKPVNLPKALARDGQRATDLQIAFCQTTENVMEQRPAFAWLPLRSYGFRFILQADWAVPSSREAILAENQLNQCLRRELPNVFCNLIEVLASNALKLPDITERLIAFKRIYALIPLPGETADFFVDSPRSIVQVLSKRNFVLAFDKGSYQLVSPTEVVRPELPKGVDTHLSAEVKKELEGVLNRGRRYIPTEALSGQLAAALHIPDLNDGIAFECLSRLSREDKDKPARTRSDADLGLLHLLFHVAASNVAQPALMQNLRRLPAIPTESGKLHSAADKVYMVDEAMAKTLQGYAEGLNLRFRHMMHAKVEGLFKQLGVLRTDGPSFLK
ncbi:NOV, partial [Symbiodinium sp. CCMP2456]